MSNVITVTKGLSELKLLDKKITRKVRDTDFITYQIGSKKINGFDSVEDFNSQVKSNYDSINDLIKRRNKIKSAIVASNAVTEVDIAGNTYTVAEAIERKNSIQYEQLLLNKLKQDYINSTSIVEQINDEVKDRLDEHLKTLFGKEGKTEPSTINSISETFNKENQAKLIDPIKIKSVFEKIETDIEEFLAEVDHELSVSNATTTIEID